MIRPPKSPTLHPDRGIHAEEAIESSFDSLAATAEAAGWTMAETAFALLNLAAARILMIDANVATEDAIARAVAQVSGI